MATQATGESRVTRFALAHRRGLRYAAWAGCAVSLVCFADSLADGALAWVALPLAVVFFPLLYLGARASKALPRRQRWIKQVEDAFLWVWTVLVPIVFLYRIKPGTDPAREPWVHWFLFATMTVCYALEALFLRKPEAHP